MRKVFYYIIIASTFLSASSAKSAGINYNGFNFGLSYLTVQEASQSGVEYDYENKSAGSLTPPGFSTTGKYYLESDSISNAMAARVGYTFTVGWLSLGLSGAYMWGLADIKLKRGAFNFYSETGVADNIENYAIVTTIKRDGCITASFEPGIIVGGSSLLFLKGAIYQMNVKIKSENTATQGITNPDYTASSQSKNLTGLGAGVGFRALLADNFYIETLYDVVNFARVNVEAASLTSTLDQITLTQTQKVDVSWSSISFTLGMKF